jgi:uncharacterized membrane protein
VNPLRAKLLDQFWALPLLCALVAATLGLVVSRIDEALDTSLSLPFLFSGGPEGARALLSAIITSMISFTGLVFSITIVVLQLTSSQFSPRILRTFMRDRSNQLTLGIFVATFVYALVVLRSVRGTTATDSFVPQLAVTLAFVFVMASVVVFLGYIHHIAHSIRAATIIGNIGDETRVLLERRHPSEAADEAPGLQTNETQHRIAADQPGVVQQVNDDILRRLAEKHSVSISLMRAVGEFVPAGAPLITVHGTDVPDEGKLRSAVTLGRERSMDEDIGFGLRQLIDIAERALSPGVNDPTTAVQVIDQLHDLLRRLATRVLRPRQILDRTGRPLVQVPEPAFVDYLHLAVDEIGHWAKDDERLRRRLRVMLDDLYEAALEEYKPAITCMSARFRPAEAIAPVDAWLDETDVGLR